MGGRALIVLDTHVLLWWVSGYERISAPAQRAIRRGSEDRNVHASAISMFEIATALRRGRLELAIPPEQFLADLATLPDVSFAPVTVDIARTAGRLSADFPGDPADRLIVSTAIVLGASLVSADERLRRMPGLAVIW